MKKAKILGIITAVLLVIALVFGLLGMHVVKPNQVAISITMGNVTGIRTSGTHFEIPFVTSYKYIDIEQKRVDGTYSTSTRDMQTISQIIAVQYIVDVSTAEDLYMKFLGNHEKNIIEPSIAETVQSVTSKYTIEEFVSERSEISEKMEEALRTKLSSYGIKIISVDILDHDFSDAYEAAVEAKKVAEQKVEQAEFERQQAEIEAETNRIKSQAIDENIKYKMFIEKWDGKLPLYMTGEDLMNFLIQGAE